MLIYPSRLRQKRKESMPFQGKKWQRVEYSTWHSMSLAASLFVAEGNEVWAKWWDLVRLQVSYPRSMYWKYSLSAIGSVHLVTGRAYTSRHIELCKQFSPQLSEFLASITIASFCTWSGLRTTAYNSHFLRVNCAMNQIKPAPHVMGQSKLTTFSQQGKERNMGRKCLKCMSELENSYFLLSLLLFNMLAGQRSCQ